jgi:PAS domain S-box-containing protein
MRILIAEDNTDSRNLLIKQLHASGHIVQDSPNGREALNKALIDPPDILITDILMPEMDGYELCIEWKTNPTLKDIPVVFYTATYTSEEDEKFAESLGVDAFILKPTDFDAFLPIINEVLKKAASGKINRPSINTSQNSYYLKEHNKILLTKLYKKVAELERDIIDRKNIEQSLKESEEKYASLVEHGNDSIVIIEDGKIRYSNPKLFEMTGFTPEEVIGKPFYNFISFEYRQLVMDRYQKRISGERVPTRYEFDVITKDGKSISVEINTSLIKRDEKTIEISIIRDTTERKKAEEALRDNEEKFRQFFENAQVYCYMVSPEGIIMEVNSLACKELGYLKQELLGQPVQMLYDPESIQKINKTIVEWKKTGIIENEELTILTRSGQRRIVLLSSGSIKDKNGNLINTISIQKDITDLKQSQGKALQVETLTRLNKAKNQMLSDVAHELRTPLQSIKGFIETLIEPDVKWTEKQQKEFLIEADKEVDILTQLIRDLLDISRIESGKMKLDKQYCTLNDIFQSIKPRLEILTANHKLDILAASNLHPLFVDKLRISQVITNLVENATKFSSMKSQIIIEALNQDNYVIIRVKDEGIGMNQETLDRIFDRFFQAELAVSGKIKGTGLGLSICKGIIEAHNGKIWVESELGKGAIFSFSIPGRDI